MFYYSDPLSDIRTIQAEPVEAALFRIKFLHNSTNWELKI